VIEQATDVFQFKWDKLKETLDADGTVANRKSAVEEFLQAVALGFASSNLPVLESGLIVNKLAKMIGLREEDIRKELDRRARQSPGSGMAEAQRSVARATDWGQGLYACASGRSWRSCSTNPAFSLV